jgi:hypothetical protein
MGGDDFVREKKALHFGIRKRCVPFYDSEVAEEPSGVVNTISRSNLLAEQVDRQRLSQQLHKSFVTVQFDVGSNSSNSSSDSPSDLTSDSLIGQRSHQ